MWEKEMEEVKHTRKNYSLGVHSYCVKDKNNKNKTAPPILEIKSSGKVLSLPVLPTLKKKIYSTVSIYHPIKA